MVQNRKILGKISLIGVLLLFVLISRTAFSAENTEKIYSLRLGIFETEENRDKMEDLLEKQSIEYTTVEIDDKNYIYSGEYKTYSEAYEAYNQYKDKGLDASIVKIDKFKTENNANELQSNGLKDKDLETIDSTVQEVSESEIKSSGESKNENEYREVNGAAVKNIIIENDMLFEGVLGEQLMFFTVNENWDMSENSYVYIRFGHSIPEKYFGSTLTLYVNNIPLKTIFLRSEYEEIEEMKVEIPADYFREGINEFKIKSYHRITEFQCDDDSNPGNWVVVFKNSYIHLEYDHKVDEVSLKEYPYPYLVEGSDDPVQTIIQLPENYTKTALKTALLISADLGHRLPFENIEADLKIYQENDIKDGNIIYIGSKSDIPARYKEFFTVAEMDRLNSDVLIKEVANPTNERYRIMFIIGDQDEKMLLAVKALFENDLQLQNQENIVWIGEKTFVNETKEEVDDYITFKELGYGPITLSGERFNSVKYDFRMPGNWKIKDEAEIYLRLRYADVINYDSSSVTVKLNGIPAFSKKLVKEGNSLDDFFVKLPDEVKDSEVLSIEIEFTLDVAKDCSSGSFDQNTWAFVSNESYIYLPHEDREEFDMENYPYPFIKDGQFSNLKILHDRGNFLDELSHAFGYLGHSLKNISDIEIIDQVPESLLPGQYIYIGKAKKDGFVSLFNDALKLGYSEKLDEYRRGQANWINVDNDSMSILQLTKTDNYNLLSLTALDEKPIKNASKYLSDFGFAANLGGDVQMIYETGQSQIVQRSLERKVIQNIKQKGEINTEALNRLSGAEIRQFLIFIGILVFASAIFIVLKRK